MKRKMLAMLCITVSMTCFAACGNKNSQESAETLGLISSDMMESETIDLQEIEALVFYPNYDEMTINQSKTKLSELTPESLCQELSYYNVISQEVSVVSFNTKENQGSIELYLNLSKEYKDFLEAAVLEDGSNKILQKQLVQSLANTFLQAYQADYIKLTVEGANLKTSFYSFEEPLSFVTSDEVFMDREDYHYELVEQTMTSEDGNFTAVYPQFTALINGSLMGPFNQEITNWVQTHMNNRSGGEETITYEIGYESENIISIVMRGEKKDESGVERYIGTFNFDFPAESLRRLKNMTDIGHIIECLEVGTNYQAVGQSKMTTEEFKQFVELNGSDDFLMTFLDYDYELSNDSFTPVGYSYYNKEGKLVVIFMVGQDKGNYVEILFEY